MTPLKNDAWWCAYCVNSSAGQCIKDVPWYASTIDCKYYDDQHHIPPPLRKKQFILKKILVETI